tara:strand:- start:835 stop:1377 length:543 start_codon:yes stop_codon:yes gene_type:complete
MSRIFFVFFFILLTLNSQADNKIKIIQNLNNINNLTFDFEQDINGKIEIGKCSILYPKKIFCQYSNNKILVSNGKSLAIKTNSSYYRYPLNKTPLNFILDKKYLLRKIDNLNEGTINNSYIQYTIEENNNKIEIFFDIKSLDIVGWQTQDIYLNTATTLLYSVKKNQKIDYNLFKLPSQN